MCPETISPLNRGVFCFYCGQPVCLPKSIVDRADSIRNQESDSTHYLLSRVFLLRCRSCIREAVYTLDQIIDFSEDAISLMGRASLAAERRSHETASRC